MLEENLKKNLKKFVEMLAGDGGAYEFKQHQFEGIQWCINNEMGRNEHCRGGLIFDDMGLGKTMIMLALSFLNPIYEPTLIVVPPNLIKQWCGEIKRILGINATVFHGAKKDEITEEQMTCMVEGRRRYIVITSYHIVGKKEYDTSTCILHKINWARVICDEAHHMKNKNTFYHGVRALKSNIKWLATGTPIQNRASDFYNLCEVVGIPSYVYKGDRDILFSKFVLHRTKLQVGLQLEEVQLTVTAVPWANADEQKLSREIHSAAKRSEGCKLNALIQARKVCILPEMVRDSLAKMRTQSLIPQYMNFELGLTASSKMDHFMDCIISRCGNGCGKLVFCQFRAEIDYVLKTLESRGMTDVATIDGRTRQTNRHSKLTHGHEVLVLQIQTACEGLNLQDKYSEIYFISPHWNPSVEAQAIGRCHRIGQTKPVRVFRFCMGPWAPMQRKQEHLSLDQEVYARQALKIGISTQLLAPIAKEEEQAEEQEDEQEGDMQIIVLEKRKRRSSSDGNARKRIK